MVRDRYRLVTRGMCVLPTSYVPDLVDYRMAHATTLLTAINEEST
jgi:hypothetical protein